MTRPPQVRRAAGVAVKATAVLQTLPTLTYRQLDYWTRQGYVRLAAPARGHGIPSEWDPQEVAVLAAMTALVGMGYLPARAATAARAALTKEATS